MAKLGEDIIRVERFASIGFGNGGEERSLIGVVELECALFREENRHVGTFLQRLTLNDDLTSHNCAPSDPHGTILPCSGTPINVI